MNLTHEEQKLLTEWLGECWHEYIGPLNKGRSHEEIQRRYKCKNCGREARELTPCRLDFSDWRAVGRLVEKVVQDQNYALSCSIKCNLFRRFENPQLAVCKAVLAYLKEPKG